MDHPAKLNANSLGLVESVIMGIAGTAPAYSIEITTSTIIGTAGILAPASILVCGLVMFGIAFAFINLNRALASAGTSYSWVSMVFGRTLGFFAGWALLVLCCVFMVSAMIPAANATLLIFDRPKMNNVHYVTLVAAAWLTLVSAVVVKGIKLTSYVQVLMTIIEGIILLAPYLGTRGTIADVTRDGGLARWRPGSIGEEDDERRLLAWLKEYRADDPSLPAIYLGYGTSDRFAPASALLAAQLPGGHVVTAEGGHDWPTWSTLWRDILDLQPFQMSPRVEPRKKVNAS